MRGRRSSAATAIFIVASGGPISAASGWLYIDSLSAYNLGVMLLVFLLSTAFAAVYFRDEAARGAFSPKQARTFAALWCGSLSSMTLVLVSDNLALMWVGVEATTLLTAFLINVHPSRESLEAMWKYVLICSIGVAFAFMGTLLAAASANGVEGLDASKILLWNELRSRAASLDPPLIRRPSSSSSSGTEPRQASRRCTPGFPTPTAKPRRRFRPSFPVSC